MAKQKLSLPQRLARKTRHELADVRRELKLVALPAVTPLAASSLTKAPIYNGPGIHQYRSYQPAIPGSWRWFREIFDRPSTELQLVKR